MVALLKDIGNVSETLLIPLYSRAIETQSKQPIIRDNKAVEMVKTLEQQLNAQSSRMQKKFAQGHMPRLLQLILALRTRCFDNYVKSFLRRHPDGVIVSLGCGLESRFERLDNGQVTWYDLDLPEVIDVRQAFFKETEHYHMLATSVLDFEWMKTLEKYKGKPHLFVAEGLFMYLYESEVKALILALQKHFPGSEAVFEVVNKSWVDKMQNKFVQYKLQRSIHLKKGVIFNFGLSSSSDLEQWGSGIEYIDEWSVFDEHEKKLGWFNIVKNFDFFRYGQWIVRYRLN